MTTEKKYRIIGSLIKAKQNGFFHSKKFLAIAVCIFISSVAIASGIIFNAGQINATVSITDTPPQYYDCTIEGQQCPCIITESVTMQPESSLMIEYNIANNEGFTLQFDITVISVDAGLTIDVLDGTLFPTTTIMVNGGDNKYFNLVFNTDDTVSTGDTLTAEVQVQVSIP